MSKQTQKEAVFTAIVNVLGEAGITVEEGQSVETYMTRERRAQVSQILFEGFKGETIELEKQFVDSKLKAYISGLTSNWIRKDKRLNGGVSYIAKNPGSRAGSGDPMLKNLRALLSTLTPGSSDYSEVETHISSRVTEIHSSKVKSKVIDFSLLPADLASKFNK